MKTKRQTDVKRKEGVMKTIASNLLIVAFFLGLVGIPCGIANLITDEATYGEWILLYFTIPGFVLGGIEYTVYKFKRKG